MLTVGVNTYITVDEANQILSPERDYNRWTTLTNTEKESYLVMATRNIDGMHYTGRKAAPEQTLSFPRQYQPEVPANIKLAQALQALYLSNTPIYMRKQLQSQGVTSIALGKASESYGNTSSNNSASGILCHDALCLLRPYLLGSVAIV